MKIALLGYGTVGSGVYELIDKNKASVKENYNKEMKIVKILVNNLNKYKDHPHFNLFTNQFDDIKEETIDLAIETIGGIHPTDTYLEYFLSKGIPVITANKDLIAEKGVFLSKLARENDTILSFEASVGGGIPILKPIQECLAGNQIKSISAVINGTTNYIMTKMYEDNTSYEDALKEAQEKGFAEADPTSDVEGLDATRKLAILSSIGYKKHIDWKKLKVEGISKVTDKDIRFAKEENYKIKLIGFSEKYSDAIYGAVRPVFITLNSQYAKIDNEYNAVLVEGDAVGELMFTGKGAGKFPTASSILGDVIDIIQNKKTPPAFPISGEAQLLEYYPQKAKYIVRFSDCDINVLTIALFNQFSSHGIKLSKSPETNDLYVQLHSDTEEELVTKLTLLNQSIAFTYKYFLVFNK